MIISEPISLSEIMRVMWIEEKEKPITYRANGIKVVLNKQEYLFEVYDLHGNIDLEFRRKYVGTKFIIRYDPDDMEIIQLMKKNAQGEKYFVAYAEKKRAFEVVPKLMPEGEKEHSLKDMKVAEEEYQRDLKALREVQEKTGITPERLIQEQQLAMKMKSVGSKKMTIKADIAENLLNQL